MSNGSRQISPASEKRRPWGSITSLLVVYVVWGANFLFVDVAVRDISPAMMMGVRFSIAGLLLLPLSRRYGSLSSDRRRAWIEAFPTAVFLFAGGSGLLAWGLVYLDSGVGAMLLATIPAWMVLLDLIATRSQMTGRIGAGLVVGLIGVALVVRPEFSSPVSPFGAFLILAAAFSWAFGSHRARATPSRHLLERTAMQMTIGGSLLIIVGIVLWALGIPPGELTVQAGIAVTWLTIVSSMIGFTAYTHALQHAPIPAVAAYPYANTILAVILGVVILGETLTPARLVGTALILLAVGFLARSPKPPQVI